MTLNFRLFLVALFLVLACIAPAVFALKPEKVPDHIIAIGEGVETTHKGICKRPHGDMLCIVGMHQEKPYGLMLLFNEDGVLVQVIGLEPPDKETVLWTHSMVGL